MKPNAVIKALTMVLLIVAGITAIVSVLRYSRYKSAEEKLLGAIPNPFSTPAVSPHGTNVFHALTNCLSDPDQDVRNDLIWTLQFHCPENYPPEKLLPIYVAGLSDSYPVVRQNAMIGLNKLGTNALAAKEAIGIARHDEDDGVRSLAGAHPL
jgi:hypothetical protein